MAKDYNEKIDFKHNLKLYFNLIKPYYLFVIGLIVIVTIAESARLGEKFLFKAVIDRGTDFTSGVLSMSSFVSLLITFAVIYLALITIGTIGHFFQIHLINRLDANIIFDLRNKFFNHLLSLSHRFHITHKTGSLISRLSRGKGAVENITDFIIFNFTAITLQFILLGGSLIYLDLKTAIAVAVTVVVFFSYSIYIINKQQGPSLKSIRAEDIEKGYISDVFMNIDSVKYYGKEDIVSEKYKELAGNARTFRLKHWDSFRYMESGQILALALGTFAVIYFSLKKLLAGEITIGSLAFIYTAYVGLMGPLYAFVYGIRRFYDSMSDFQALFEYDKIKNDIKDGQNSEDLKINKGEIEFDKIKFSYHDRKIIDNVSLKINSGEKVALVGHSGSGKTTIVKLLYRFYDVNSGAIKIDGKDIRDVKQESLREEMSIVPQEAILFDDSIYNNILFSNPEAGRKEVMVAIKFAQLDELVNKLSKRENTIVGERGVKLSGGEKQRVSIARAILADKKVLVLDEATSSLDSKTESEIQKDLAKLMKGRTSIIIAHRLSTIMSADKIVVMDKGKIVQIGTHRELIKNKGVYRELWNLQKGGYID